MTTAELTKREWELLGRVFGAEITGRSVLQSRARGYTDLAERGMVERITLQLGGDRFGTIEVTGWALTIRGHLLYCAACDRFGDSDQEAG